MKLTNLSIGDLLPFMEQLTADGAAGADRTSDPERNPGKIALP